MEELNLLNGKTSERLWQALEEATGLLLPKEKERFGEISFHIYHYVQNDTNGKNGDASYVFQIRWGMHKIYSQKRICLNLNADCLAALIEIIKNDKNQIKKELIEYIENQLATIVTLELEPEFNRRFSMLRQFEMQVSRGRKKNLAIQTHGWPLLCVFISWYDELSEFQEFIFPIKIDAEIRQFVIPTQKIITQFQKYRDSLI